MSIIEDRYIDTAPCTQIIEQQDNEYRHMVQILNKEQKEFFYHVLHLIKT